MAEHLQLQFYGVRGSVPVPDRKNLIFGGNTSCLFVKAGSRSLVFDCGTGGTALGKKLVLSHSKQVDLFLSHVHLDHILGLLSFAPLFRADIKAILYSEERNGKTIREQLDQMMSPPLWPVNTASFSAATEYKTIAADRTYDLGDGIILSTMRSHHPDLCTVFRLEYGGVSIVYCLDYEHDDDSFPKLAEFCRDADFVVYDAAFSCEEYETHRGWGHSTWQKGVELQTLSGAKQIALTHFPYEKTDGELLELDKTVQAANNRCFLAREGMQITLTAGEEATCRLSQPSPAGAEFCFASGAGALSPEESSPVNLKNLLEIAAALSQEKDYNKLLARILREAMDITRCDGGTLYLLIDDALHFKIMRTVSMNFYKGADGESPGLPPVPLSRQNVCACAAIEKRMTNIENVYDSEAYDFSGPRKYDMMTGYHTQSMLVVPMENHYGDIIGVLQLINAQDDSGCVIPFAPRFEEPINSLASLAAVSITNMNYIQDIRALLHSFVEVISTAIDERTPYNANHTRNMVRYAQAFIRGLNRQKEEALHFSPEREEQFLMSVWLHDIGKMVIPLEVMDKESRLGSQLKEVENRFRTVDLLARIDLLEGRTELSEYNELCAKRSDYLQQIRSFNTVGFLNDESLETIKIIASEAYIDETGRCCPLLTPEETVLLSIRKGTLSDQERRTMESHVEITEKLLSKIRFSRDYDRVTDWASGHHEYLNGSGYPRHLSGDQLPLEVRMLTVLDIYDALTARDRPYKPPMPVEKALAVLEDMAAHGQLDQKLVALFRETGAWEADETPAPVN